MAAEEIKKIAEEAIENINKITSLINNRTLPPPSQNASAPSSAINELQRQFPTLNWNPAQSASPRSSSRRSSSRPHPYHTSASRAGRLVKYSIVTRDVLIIEKGKEIMPTKTEKVEMERKGRVSSGFDVVRSWNAEELHKE